jgi:hypothetical protein
MQQTKQSRRGFLFGVGLLPAIAKAERTNKPHIGLLPHQAELLASTEPEVLMTGGRGSGMSYALHAWLNQSSGRSLLVLEHDIEHYDLPKQGKFDCLTVRELIEKMAERASRYTDLPHYDRIAFDVPVEHLPLSVYMDALSRWGRNNGSRKLHNARFAIASVPPPQGMKHWVAKRFLVTATTARRVIRATLQDNPHLDSPSYGQQYRKMLNAMDDPTRRLWLDGSWES